MEHCEEHTKLTETVNKIDLAVARMEVALSNAIKETSNHIAAGFKFRITIISSCIVLVGTIVGGIVRFSVMEYKVSVVQNQQDKLQTQIYDLNYTRGKAEGLAEKQNAR